VVGIVLSAAGLQHVPLQAGRCAGSGLRGEGCCGVAFCFDDEVPSVTLGIWCEVWVAGVSWCNVTGVV
jgi:hypothetical protein